MMNNREAIALLRNLEDALDSYCELNEEGKTAFRMAIESLELFGNSEHLPSAQSDVSDINVGDMVSRQQAIHAFDDAGFCTHDYIVGVLRELPPAQPERDIPIKPIETTDKAWGIPRRQAVCPKCDYYLGHVAFLGDYKGKRITYCETCGQAIDWEGWDFDG